MSSAVMLATPQDVPPEYTDDYTAYGAAAEYFDYTGPEVVMGGPAGTGKTRAGLEKVNYLAVNVPRFRALLVRKTLASLKSSALVTFDEKVRPDLAGAIFRGETAKRPPRYVYANGAEIVIGGMDKASKVMSSEYDFIYVPEATELTEGEWEALSSRLRNGAAPFQQLAGDCNPDAPEHWLKKRAERGQLLLIESRHEDNPTVTLDYLARLDALTGVRKARLRYGIWAAAEGMVYESEWDAARNLVNLRDIQQKQPDGTLAIPGTWPRFLSIDIGYTNPFVCQWWAEDPDGRAYRYRELYMTQRLVRDHAADIMRLSRWGERGGDPFPHAIYVDPSAAEAKAQLRQHLGAAGRWVRDANNEVTQGIQAVQARMRPAGDGVPRLFLVRDALVERDRALVERKLPTCTEEEIPGYIWDERGGKKREQVVKENDHGCDAMRYFCAKDLRPRTVKMGPRLY